jgi:ribonuclease R
MRARYAVEPLGHYGLAKKKYTHFTSPIRRYADLVVHRALFDKVAAKEGALKEIAEHISVTERNSADAERDSKDVKLFAFLKAQLASGSPIKYPALVTDVRNFGFFVDVPGLAMSGLVPLSTIEDDFYVFDESRRNLVGRRTRRVISLGDKLTVQVAKVDSFKKQVDFCLAADDLKIFAQRPKSAPRSSESRPQPARPDMQRVQSNPQHWKRKPANQSERPQRQDSRGPRRDESRPQSSPVGSKRSQPSQSHGPRRDDAQRRDARRQDSRPAKASSQPARPQLQRENKFVLKTSVRQFGGKQRRSR